MCVPKCLFLEPVDKYYDQLNSGIQKYATYHYHDAVFSNKLNNIFKLHTLILHHIDVNDTFFQVLFPTHTYKVFSSNIS